jgi:hypothetical protein
MFYIRINKIKGFDEGFFQLVPPCGNAYSDIEYDMILSTDEIRFF